MKKFGKIMAVALVIALVGSAAISLRGTAAESGLTEAQKKELEPFIRELLVKNPDIVTNALDAYQANMKKAEEEKQKEALVKNRDAIMNSGAPTAGPKDADVTVVEFFDYNCGWCKRAVDDVVKTLENDKKVRVMFFDFPIMSEESHKASGWALAADKQGKYYEYHVALMRYPGVRDDAAYEQIGKDIGLDVEKLKKDAQDPELQKQLEKHIALARELGINGTPAFIVGDTFAPGYMDYETMKAAIAKARGQ